MKFLKKSYPRTTLIIDGDLYLYRATTSCEEETDWGDDIWSLSIDIAAARRVFETAVANFTAELLA